MRVDAMAQTILQETSSSSFIDRLRLAANFPGEIREKEYLDPGVSLNDFPLSVNDEYYDLSEEVHPKQGKPFTLTGISRVANPILSIPLLLLKAVRLAKGNTCLDRNTNQDIAVASMIFGEKLSTTIEYEPSEIISHASELSAKTMFSDAMNDLAYKLGEIEMDSITRTIRKPSPKQKKLDLTYLSNFEFLDNVRVFNMRLRGQLKRGWNESCDQYSDTWGRWYTVLDFKGMKLRCYKGVTFSIVVFDNKVMIGSKDVIDHVYTLIASMFNWHYVEGMSRGKLKSVMRDFRQDVFMTRNYTSIVNICRSLEPLSNALADLQSDCGSLFVREALKEFADHLGISLFDLVETLAHNASKPLLSKNPKYLWLSNLTRMSLSDLMRFGQLYKPGMYAIVNVEKGLKKLAKRVTRRFTDDITPTFELIAFCCMSLCRKWTEGLGHSSLPNLVAMTDDAQEKMESLISDFSLQGCDQFWRIHFHIDEWKDIQPWKVVDPGIAPPLTDFIRDKRVHLPTVKFDQISKDDEVRYVLCDYQSNELPKLAELLDDLKSRHSENTRQPFEYSIDWNEFSPRAKQLIKSKSHYLTEANPKEREQKEEARFFATGTFAAKKQIGYANELARRVAELLPGNTMVISDENRRQVIESFGMSTSLNQKVKTLKMHIDISGHNQSFTTSPTKYWFEFIGNCLGIPDYKYLAYLFNDLFFHYKLPFLRAHYWHTGQNGGIEGWCNYAWGAHTGAVAELFLHKYGYTGSAAAYGDDVIVTMVLPESPNYNYLETSIADHFALFNQEVKVAQTSITRARATLTRKTYVLGAATSSDLKKLMTSYQIVDAHVQSDLSSISAISSSIASAMSDSNDFWLCCYMKWLLSVPIACGTWYACIRANAEVDLPAIVVRAVNKFVSVKTMRVDINALLPLNVDILFGDFILRRQVEITTGNDMVTATNRYDEDVFMGDVNSSDFSKIVLDDSAGRRLVALKANPLDMFVYMVTPQQIGGLGVLTWMNSVITGISDTRAELLEMLNGLGDCHMLRKVLGASCEGKLSYSDIIAHRYAIKPLVMSHSDIIAMNLRSKMEEITKNRAILDYIALSDDREYILIVTVTCMAKYFSQRIAQKCLDCSDIAILDQIISKVSSSGAIMRLLDHPEQVLRQLNNLGPTNLKRLCESKSGAPTDCVKEMLDMNKVMQFEGRVRFVDPHEVGMQYLTNHLDDAFHITIKKLSPFLLDGSQRPSFRHQEVKPKYGKLSIMEMAITDIVFRKVLDLARFITWLEADQNMIGCNVSVLGDILISRMSQWTMQELRPMIPKPTGGELFHRIDNHGFTPGVMMRTLPRYSGCVSTNFLPDFVMSTAGIDSNINYGYLDAICRFSLLISCVDMNLPAALTVIGFSQQAFSLAVDVSNLRLVYKIQKPRLQEMKSLEGKQHDIITPRIRALLHWLATVPSYEDVQSISKLGVIKSMDSGGLFSIASEVIDYILRCTDLPVYNIKDTILKSILYTLNIPEEYHTKVANVLRTSPTLFASSATMRHQDLREELRTRLFEIRWPQTKIPNIFSAMGKEIIMSMIVTYALVFIKCPDHEHDNCLTVDWLKTRRKATTLRRFIKNLRIPDNEVDVMFWVSSEGLVYLTELLEESGQIPTCMCRKSPSKAQLGSALKCAIVTPYNFTPDFGLRPVISSINSDNMLRKVMRGTIVLKRIHEVMGKSHDEANYHYHTLDLLQRLSSNDLRVFDATAGIGRVNVACHYLGIDVVSATIDEVWLRRGLISGDVIVDPKYNYCDSKTWPITAIGCNVHYIDTHVLYTGDCKQGDLDIPDTVEFIVLKISEQVLESITSLIPDIDLMFPFKYLIACMPSARRNLVVLSKYELPAQIASNQVIRSQLRYLRHNPHSGPYDCDEIMSPDERESIVMDMFIEVDNVQTQNSVNSLSTHDPWNSSLYLRFVDSWMTGKLAHESTEDYIIRSMNPRGNIPSKAKHAMKVLLESGIDIKNILSGDYLISRSRNQQAIAWIIRSLACANVLSPAQFFIMRMLPALRGSYVTWSMLALIRRWTTVVMTVYRDLGLQFAQSRYVLKQYTRDLAGNTVNLNRLPKMFISPSRIKPEKLVRVEETTDKEFAKLADLMISTVIFDATGKDKQYLFRTLLGGELDLEPTQETALEDAVVVVRDGVYEVRDVGMPLQGMDAFRDIMSFDYDSDQSVESEYFGDESLMTGIDPMSESDFLKAL